MRHLFLILFCIPMLCILTSCAPPAPKLSDSFNVPISVSGTLDCAAELYRESDTLTLTLTSPPSLAGLRFTYTNGEQTASYNNLSCITEENVMPDTALPRLIHDILGEIKNAAYLRTDEGGDVFQLHGATVTIRGGVPVRIDITDPAYSILAK